MNGSTRVVNDQNKQAQLAEQFNEFYLQLTSSTVDQIGSYRIEKEIGEGAFGKVYLATHIILNLKVVLKCGLVDDPNIVREIYYHKQLKNKNIVNLYEVIKTEKFIWLALEYCSGGELFYYIYEKKRLGLKEIRNLFIQIVLAVKYVHSLNLSHRDLKLENILLADSKKSLVKLSDFGFVREYNPQTRRFLSTVCGTNVYMAPELLKNEKYSGFAIDIWSLGVILYTMVYGEMPFDEDDDLKTKYKITHDEPRYPEIIPPDLIALIKKMLSKDPQQRPNLNEILNSHFLIDLYTKYLKKQKTSCDAESVISIHQHYNQNKHPFTTKLEKDLLHRLQKLNVNMEQLEYGIYKNEMNPLTAFYELLLTEEFNKKKKKYNKEKQRKYYEAKKSLIRSGKRVKSVLSLSDQSSSYSSHPIEKITSTLSLTSLRNNSASRYNDSRRSSFQDKRNSLILNQLPSTAETPASPRGRHGLPQQLEEEENGEAQSSLTLAELNTTQPPPRIVAFDPTDAISVRKSSVSGQASTLSEGKKSKDSKLLSKLQFWKKSKKSNENIDLDNSSTLRDHDLTFSLRQSVESPMDSNMQRSSEIPDSISPFTHVNNKRSATNVFPEDSKLEEFNPNNNLQNPLLLNVARTKESLTTKGTKTRPTSMISQFSQFSQMSNMSHMSTMASGSEFLDESDIMDEDYDFEEEGIYESSIDNSHEQVKQAAGPVTPSSGGSTSRTPTKKRPKYTRNQSSDLSIASVSTATTTNRLKKNPLSQLSSNSSEDSGSSTPLILEAFNRENIEKNFQRPSSPDLPTSKQWKNSMFSNQLNAPVPQYPNSAFTTTTPNQMLRSNSPPVKPFNRLNFKLNRHGGNDKKSKQSTNINPTQEDKWSPLPKATTYQPVITEEDELTP